MRIISGKFKGRSFPGKLPSGIRPTTDSTKEAIFNTLANIIDFKGLRVLDLFAGGGSLGVEALSRGADSVTFVDKSGKSLAFIGKIIGELNIQNADITKGDAIKYVGNSAESYGLIFADPPYEKMISTEIIYSVFTSNILETGGVFVLEHALGENLYYPDNCEVITEKQYGSTHVSITTKT